MAMLPQDKLEYTVLTLGPVGHGHLRQMHGLTAVKQGKQVLQYQSTR